MSARPIAVTLLAVLALTGCGDRGLAMRRLPDGEMPYGNRFALVYAPTPLQVDATKRGWAPAGCVPAAIAAAMTVNGPLPRRPSTAHAADWCAPDGNISLIRWQLRPFADPEELHGYAHMMHDVGGVVNTWYWPWASATSIDNMPHLAAIGVEAPVIGPDESIVAIRAELFNGRALVGAMEGGEHGEHAVVIDGYAELVDGVVAIRLDDGTAQDHWWALSNATGDGPRLCYAIPIRPQGTPRPADHTPTSDTLFGAILLMRSAFDSAAKAFQ